MVGSFCAVAIIAGLNYVHKDKAMRGKCKSQAIIGSKQAWNMNAHQHLTTDVNEPFSSSMNGNWTNMCK